ncbi:MAG: hypothetical protein AAFQ37_13485 [Bacteroidota bacterium]
MSHSFLNNELYEFTLCAGMLEEMRVLLEEQYAKVATMVIRSEKVNLWRLTEQKALQKLRWEGSATNEINELYSLAEGLTTVAEIILAAGHEYRDLKRAYQKLEVAHEMEKREHIANLSAALKLVGNKLPAHA